MGLETFGLKNQIVVRYLYWVDEQTFLGLQLSSTVSKKPIRLYKRFHVCPFQKDYDTTQYVYIQVMKVSWSYTIKEF